MRLCNNITQPRKEYGVYTSRWKLALSACNSVRACLLNSQALLEGTNLQAGHLALYEEADKSQALLEGTNLQAGHLALYEEADTAGLAGRNQPPGWTSGTL